MNLEKIRKKTGLNQSMFWGRIGVTQSGGSRYESGRRLPKPVKMLVDIAYGNAKERGRALLKLIPAK
jgi:DNA-binding transcriptional regulator YiaG